MRPPSFWNFCGSRRNSMISCSSSFASSTPATSLNVTFFCETARQLRLALAERQRLVAAALHLAHEEDPEADEQQDRRPRIEQRRPGAGRRAPWRSRARPRSNSLFARPSYWVGAWVRNVSLDFSTPLNLVARNRDAGDLAGFDLGHEGAEADGLLASLESRREVPDEDPDDDEHHPEQQALQSRVHSLPPNGSKLKTTTDFVAW